MKSPSRSRNLLAALGLTAAVSLTPPLSLAAKPLVYCSEGSPESFNPQLASSGTAFNASAMQLYNRLAEFKLGTTDIVPGLAESWSVSDDGLSYTFKLRRGVKFHRTKYFKPSRDFNADDVLFTFNRQRLDSHPYHKVSNAIYRNFEDMDLGTLIKDIVKIDDYTVRFDLTRREAPFIANMAHPFASILSAEYGDQLMKQGKPEQMDVKPIGTGPFLFQRYQKDAFIRYKAHPGYWRGKEKTEKLVFAITVDPSVRYARLRKGECHVMAYPLPADLAAMREHIDIRVDEQPGFNIGYWAFNTKVKPFGDQRVRLAFSHAVNRKAILDALYQGSGTQAKNPIPPTMWSYNDKIEDYEYNPQKARELLKQAGIKDGLKTDIWAMPVQRPYNPNARKMAEMIQQDLKNIGVDAKVVSYEWGTYLKKARDGEHQTVLLGWTGATGDPDNFFGNLLSCAAAHSGNNHSFWCHEEFDKLITESRQSSDHAERVKMYERAQEIFKQQAPWLTIAHSVQYQVRRKEVKGLKNDPFGFTYFSGAYLEN